MSNETQHPCPAPEPKWWAGRNEEHFEIGPCETKEEAIQEALGQCCFNEIKPEDFLQIDGWTVSMHVALCETFHLDLSKKFDAHEWIESIDESLSDEEGPDESGDNGPLSELTKEQIDDLDARVKKAIWDWQHENNIKLQGYWFGSVTNRESVVLDHPYNGETK